MGVFLVKCIGSVVQLGKSITLLNSILFQVDRHILPCLFFKFMVLPLTSVMNSSRLSFPLCMSILSARSKVKVILSASYRPRAAYLNTSNVMYSMMFIIRLEGIGDLIDLK